MTSSDRRFEPLGGDTLYEGRIISLHHERFRYPDGEVVEREIIRHQGAVGIVAHDGTDLFLVRQPRETVGDPDFLEIPAGRLDVEGESPLEAARRELAEEIGKAAATWEPITDYVSSVGIMDETVHLFLATGLSDASAEAEENERIEIVRWPLADLDGAIAATRDAKTLIGLLWLKSQ
ncbi:MAG TPA: NUDIX hydrolase [Solirubrobacteraceae bacterium]|nr:NUDIX hydrolase [Solirubrobacteraceae bacterium]